MSEQIAQGTLDGFCGIYATAHLIAELSDGEYGDVTERAFFQILRSLERNNKLTAKRIASPKGEDLGFRCELIAKAVNDIPKRSGFGLAAAPFTKAAFQNSHYRGNAKLVFDDRCGMVVRVDAGDHWVSTFGFDRKGRYRVFDPSHDREHKRLSRMFWDEGLMLGPINIIQDL